MSCLGLAANLGWDERVSNFSVNTILRLPLGRWSREPLVPRPGLRSRLSCENIKYAKNLNRHHRPNRGNWGGPAEPGFGAAEPSQIRANRVHENQHDAEQYGREETGWDLWRIRCHCSENTESKEQLRDRNEHGDVG